MEKNNLLPSPNLIKSFRSGNKLSRYIRHVFENINIKKFFGVNLALVLVSSSFLTNGVSAEDIISDNPKVEDNVILKTTTKEIKFPVTGVKITQKYSFFHPGIDLDGKTGDPITPIAQGRVVDLKTAKTGYGYSIVIDHGCKMLSLYAHLSKIYVRVGQEVTTADIIGEMGATGRAFGDHLHLEVYQEGKRINPLILLRQKTTLNK